MKYTNHRFHSNSRADPWWMKPGQTDLKGQHSLYWFTLFICGGPCHLSSFSVVYNNTSSRTEKGPKRSLHGGKWAKKSDYLVSHGNMSQHSIALIALNSIQGAQCMWKVAACVQTFYTVALWYFDELLIQLSHQITEESLCETDLLVWMHCNRGDTSEHLQYSAALAGAAAIVY